MFAPALRPRDEAASSQPTAHRILASCLAHADGTGPTVDLGFDHAGLLVVSMGIHHVIENERLIVSIWGSPDGNNWGDRPLVTFPPKSYSGIYATFLNLSRHPEIGYLRASWNMDRVGRGGGDPLFGFQISVQESGTRVK